MNKIYYKDPYTKTFSSRVLRQDIDEKGNRFVVLDKTAFYPTGGGQPHDVGTLNGINVLDVEEMDGEIRHYIAGTLNEKEVSGEINWERRFDHMQQHSGQHILSAAFEELFDFKTVSFHLGKEISTIDLDISGLSEQEGKEAEERANQIIMENRPIETKWVTTEELSQYKLRKQLSVTENIRLVIIPDFDYNGCGGTHPAVTGQVGSIKILDWEKQKKKIRVQFVCGGRILKQLHQKQKEIKELSQLLNAPEQELAGAAKRLLNTGKELEKSAEELRDKLLHYEGLELTDRAVVLGNTKMISETFRNRSIQELQKLARLILSESEDIVVLFVNEADGKLQFVCARGSIPNVNMKQISTELIKLINGKGGGNETFAQGGGEALIPAEAFQQNAVEKLLQFNA